jgi:hypothetical protein
VKLADREPRSPEAFLITMIGAGSTIMRLQVPGKTSEFSPMTKGQGLRLQKWDSIQPGISRCLIGPALTGTIVGISILWTDYRY